MGDDGTTRHGLFYALPVPLAKNSWAPQPPRLLVPLYFHIFYWNPPPALITMAGVV